MDPNQLVKDNVRALLKARKKNPEDLAKWVKNSKDWIDKIFRYPNRTFPIGYWDSIAVFLGVEVYQLLQPGIAERSERRSGSDRRKHLERRVSQAVLSEKALDVDIVHIVRALSLPGRRRAIEILMDVLNSELPRGRTTTDEPDGWDHIVEKPRVVRPRVRPK